MTNGKPWTKERLDTAISLVNDKGLSLNGAALKMKLTRKALTDAMIRHGYKIKFKTTIIKA